MIRDAESHICSDGLLHGLAIHRAKLCRTNTPLLEEAQNGGVSKYPTIRPPLQHGIKLNQSDE